MEWFKLIVYDSINYFYRFFKTADIGELLILFMLVSLGLLLLFYLFIALKKG
jgi:hypothetical protein